MNEIEDLNLEEAPEKNNISMDRRAFMKSSLLAALCLAGNGMIASLLEGCADEESFQEESSQLDPFAHFDARKQLPRLPYREYVETDVFNTAEPINMDKSKPLLKRLFEKELEIQPNGLPIEDFIDCAMNDEETYFKLKNLSQTEFFEIIKKYRGNEDFTVEMISPDEISITISKEDSENFEIITIKNGDRMIITKINPYEKRELSLNQKEKTQISTYTDVSTLKTDTENGGKTTEPKYEFEQTIKAFITSNGYLIIFQESGISISKDNDPLFTQINDPKTLIESITTFKKYIVLAERFRTCNIGDKIITDMIKSVQNLDELKILMEYFDGNYHVLLNTLIKPFYDRINGSEVNNHILRYIIPSLDKFMELIQIIPKNPKIFSAIMCAYGPEYRAWDSERSSNNMDEYRDPISTFESGWADCDDFAVINYSWAYANGYNPQFKHIPSHVMVWYIDEKNRTVVLDNNNATIMSKGLTIDDYVRMHPLISDEYWEEFLKTENREPLEEKLQRER